MVGLTFVIWFALVVNYSASKLSAFTFITPLFGVAASYFILHDELTLAFGVAALLVIAGLYLVNRPSAVAPVPLRAFTSAFFSSSIRIASTLPRPDAAINAV